MVDVLEEVAEKEISVISILKEILLPDLADHLNWSNSFWVHLYVHILWR